MEIFNFLLKITTESLKKVIEFLFRSYKTVYYTFKRWCLQLDFTIYNDFVKSAWKFGDDAEDKAALIRATGVSEQLDGQLEWIRAQIDCLDTNVLASSHSALQIDDTLSVLTAGVDSKKERENIRSKYRKMVRCQLADLESARARDEARLEQLHEEEILCSIEKDVVNAVVAGANSEFNTAKRQEVSFAVPLPSEEMDMIENITILATRPVSKIVDKDFFVNVPSPAGSSQAGSGDTVVTQRKESRPVTVVVQEPIINVLNNKQYRTIEPGCYPRATEFIRRYVRNKNLMLQPDELSALTVQRYVESFCNDLNFDEGSKSFLIQAAMVCAIIPDSRDYNRAMVLASPEVRERFAMLACLSQGF
nr:hypothetical protein [Tolivirales sp.]